MYNSTQTQHLLITGVNSAAYSAGRGAPSSLTLTSFPPYPVCIPHQRCCAVSILPGLTIVPTANIDTGADGILNAGDKIDYSIAVTNIGSTCLTDVLVETKKVLNITCNAVYSGSSFVGLVCHTPIVLGYVVYADAVELADENKIGFNLHRFAGALVKVLLRLHKPGEIRPALSMLVCVET